MVVVLGVLLALGSASVARIGARCALRVGALLHRLETACAGVGAELAQASAIGHGGIALGYVALARLGTGPASVEAPPTVLDAGLHLRIVHRSSAREEGGGERSRTYPPRANWRLREGDEERKKRS